MDDYRDNESACILMQSTAHVPPKHGEFGHFSSFKSLLLCSQHNLNISKTQALFKESRNRLT